jgi:hypothetical protein
VHDPRLDPHDRLRVVCDFDDDLPFGAFRIRLAEDPGAAGLHREIGIVDLGGEAGRIDLERLVAYRERCGGFSRRAADRDGLRRRLRAPPAASGCNADDQGCDGESECMSHVRNLLDGSTVRVANETPVSETRARSHRDFIHRSPQ